MAKLKDEMKLSDMDASFVISSFKNKERRNNPSSIPKPLVPEYDKNQEQESEPEGTVQSASATKTETSREETRRKRSKSPDYESLFIQEVEITARTGKSVYIRNEHHENIMKIVQVIGKNQVSLFSYIDNVLSQHFEVYEDEITELYNKKHKSVFKLK